MPRSRLGDTFATFDLGRNPGLRAALNACRAVALGERWCAFLSGGYGTGKTHLVIAAMHEYGIERSYFWKVPDFLAEARRRQFEEPGLEDWLAWLQSDTLPAVYAETTAGPVVLRREAYSPRLLVFDDLGAENRTEWASEQLYRVLDARCDAELPTILTTNQDPSRLDGRLLSRYASGLVVCQGKDLRR